jgi:hypothetical protein
MRLAGSLWLLTCIALAACGGLSSEGGVTGTGISAISGNIAAVREQDAAAHELTLPFPIRVTIAEFPAIEDITDAEGIFQLDGAFSGALTLQFSNAENGDEIGPLSLEVPAGSQAVLENIEITTAAPPSERVRPRAVRLFDVFGRADVIECNADGSATLLLTDDGRPPRQFMIALTAETEIVRRDGAALTCADIHRGAALKVEGFLRQADQTLIALRLVVAAARPPQPGPSPRPERLRGRVHEVSCERDVIHVDQDGADSARRVVRLSDRTEFRCQPDAQAPCDCSAIAVGAPIAVTGVIFPERPGQVQADVVFPQSSAVPVDLTGTITRLACNAGGFAMQESATGQEIRVAITLDTTIGCRSGVECACTDLAVRQCVRVEGLRPPDGGTVTAVRIAVLARRVP